LWLSMIAPGDTYLRAILPGALLWGLGLGLTVAPLTASVLAAVRDDDLGEATAVNDAASRVGALLIVALVPVLVGVGADQLGPALAHGYRPAMLVMFGLSVAAAIVSAVFVSDHAGTPDQIETSPQIFPQPVIHSCALPVGQRTLTSSPRS
jgi:MFS family permease